MNWTTAELNLAKELSAQGHSASQIAALLPHGRTRASVIGALFRARPPQPKPVVPTRPIPIPGMLHIEFMDLKDHQCRWPSDEKDDFGFAKFCGCNRWGENQYCLPHAQLAYEPRRGRR